MADASFVQDRIVTVDNASSFDFYEMGVISLPARSIKAMPFVQGDERGFTIQIWARRTSGAGNLYLDCLCPIPVDEGYLFIDGANSAANVDPIRYGESPLGDVQCITDDDDTSSFSDVPEFEHHNFRLPPGDGRMIVAFARDDSSNLADYLYFPPTGNSYYERWSSLRGAE